MSALPFVENPTLADLEAFRTEVERITAARRELLRRARECRQTAQEAEARADGFVNRAIRRKSEIENPYDRKMPIGNVAPGTRQKAADLRRESDRLEGEADVLLKEIWELEFLHQMQAHDWREYLSRGLELPAHRRAIYERNAEPVGAKG